MNGKLTAALFAAILSGSVALLNGCKDDAGSGGSGSRADGAVEKVAVVDLDRVANDLGWVAKMQTNMTNYQGALRNDLIKLATGYQQQIDDKKKTLAPKDTDQLTPDQQQVLIQLIVAARQQVQQLDQAAGQQYQQYQQESLKRYRDALTPVVRQVAQEKKIGVVITQTGTVVYSDPAVDITNAVVDAAKKTPPTLTEVPMPSLQGPTGIQVSPTAAPTTQSTGSPTTKPISKP